MVNVRTIFISSRMDELAMERRSAHSAIIEARLTPILFEMEPQKNERAKIDALVDRADFFIGIYYNTLGYPSEFLNDLCPIEYELFRFLARFDLCDEPESWQLTEPAQREITASLADPSYVSDIRSRIRSEIAQREGALFDVISHRVLLFLRVLEPDNQISRKLAEFLEGLPRHEFCNQEIEPQEGVAEFVPEKRYVPAHLSLFEAVYEILQKRKTSGDLTPLQSGAGFYMECRISGEDRPGLLYRLLEACLDQACNIKSLLMSKESYSMPAQGAADIRIFLEPFVTQWSERQTVRNLQSALRLRLRNYSVAADLVMEWRDLAEESPKVPDLRIFYEISTADVPGIIMAVTRLVSHIGGSIEFAYFGRKGVAAESQFFKLIIGIEPVGLPSPIAEEDGRKTLEYELGSVMGIGVVTRVTRSSVEKSLRAPRSISKKRQAGVVSSATVTSG
ncbi:MAG TPA: DUF4062 domain-containing protein [Thermoanaerobaculia bacterium]|nr:DUF4062 domain-containing protein [Thermoanaerobaculia bacterium]